jgi:serine/threonine protein kinase
MAKHVVDLNSNRWTFDDANRLGARGGFGTVYVGKGSDDREVAIKILHAVGDDGKRELNFAKAFAGRATKRVIPILDCGIDGATSRACIVMEKAEKTLREFISEHGAIESQDTAAIIRQIILGLLEAGDWVHRDLKPENILLREDGWQVADFGIARQADGSTSSHTPSRVSESAVCSARAVEWSARGTSNRRVRHRVYRV